MVVRRIRKTMAAVLASCVAPLLWAAWFGLAGQLWELRAEAGPPRQVAFLDSAHQRANSSESPRRDDSDDRTREDLAAPETSDRPRSEDRETRSGPLRILKQIGSHGAGLSSWARSLGALGSWTRVPFARKTRTLLSPEALDLVQRGAFPTNDPASSSRRPSHFDGTLRIVSWNIERGLQYEKIVQALKEDLPADVYLLQEVDKGARRTDLRDVASSLASELEIYFAFGIEFQELIQGRSGQPALHGQAILSRFPISQTRVLRFEHQPKDWSRDWFQPRHGGRMALVCKIETPAGKLLVYNAHLESRGSDAGRAKQMEEIITDIQRTEYSGPVVIAGDLNTETGLQSPVFQVARLNDIRLLPFERAISPASARRQKDWILGAGIAASQAIIEDRVSASDHKPVLAELRFN